MQQSEVPVEAVWQKPSTEFKNNETRRLCTKNDGIGYRGRVEGKTITVDGDDLETAELIQAGLHPTAEHVAANVLTLAEHQKKIEGNKVQLAPQQGIYRKQQQDIAANKQQIQQSIKDIQENAEPLHGVE